MRPPLNEILSSVRVVSLPLRQRFRGITTREVALVEGPRGWAEFSPFLEYDDAESAAWLAAAIEFGWGPEPAIIRSRIAVNATLPAVAAAEVPGVLDGFPGCRTVKVKVAERGQTLADDAARVAAARECLGPAGRLRIDANGGWNVDEAEHAIRELSVHDLEYVEQPCATVEELGDIRQRVKYLGVPIAADESVRRAADPLAVAQAGAADLLVIKAQPLGGIRGALDIVDRAGLPVVISSALETSVGISMGAYLAAAITELPYDCGLATVSLLAADITAEPLIPVAGSIPVRRVVPDPALLDQHCADPERTAWWMSRIERCYQHLSE